GEPGGAVRSLSSTARRTRASSLRKPSLTVTCFCACAPSRYGSCRLVLSDMFTPHACASVIKRCGGAHAAAEARRCLIHDDGGRRHRTGAAPFDRTHPKALVPPAPDDRKSQARAGSATGVLA